MGNKLYEENSVQAIAESIRSKLGVETTYKISEMSGAINTIVKPNGTTNITENGYHNVTAYEQAYVHVEGGITPTGTINIYNNDDYDVTNYAQAHVAVPQPIGKKTVTENGTDIDIAQYATLDVTVQPNIGTKTVNQNGVYKASDDNLDGYSQVNVSTPVPTGKKNITQNGTDIDVSSYALADVAVQPNVGTKSINTNGVYKASDDNLDGYSQVTVTTPVPTGTKQITANGTGIDVSAYATADVTVQPNVGTKTINQNGVYNASSDSLDGYSQVTVDVPPFPPELMDVNAFVLESDSTTITMEYDPTKNVAQVMSFLLYNRHIDRNTVYMTSARKNVYTNEWTNINYIIASSWNDAEEYGNSNPQYSCTVTFDSANETITVTTLSGTFKAGYPYMTMVLYDPYPVEEPEP